MGNNDNNDDGNKRYKLNLLRSYFSGLLLTSEILVRDPVTDSSREQCTSVRGDHDPVDLLNFRIDDLGFDPYLKVKNKESYLAGIPVIKEPDFGAHDPFGKVDDPCGLALQNFSFYSGIKTETNPSEFGIDSNGEIVLDDELTPQELRMLRKALARDHITGDCYNPVDGPDNDCNGPVTGEESPVPGIIFDFDGPCYGHPCTDEVSEYIVHPVDGLDNSKINPVKESFSPDVDLDSKVIKLSRFKMPSIEEISVEKLDQFYDKLMNPNFDPDDEE
ncbi:hypothetical protein HOE37_02500 [Candidatus Woesearchaeota archaeon]|jgi:hypothetical protein|nr:hypothetical protein [Candidatus Woesearchaeota archaeon]MBT4110704.1 hypothetical protein [Candidatus Woesearchaeota archaeon]MBT4336300.1 hypothetical protein [Candidatus Woesearchaeota archaeon]MBT4469339.1 hypothetical protein [Candidatus Woesearchaeota archaeon]MBT6743838.1 hypothetical protein [Candidatus Woesearchaeota archaeon]